MITRKPKGIPLFQKLLGGAIIFEALAFGASYFFWNKLNKSRDFREKTRDSAPWALEMYYKFGEMIDSNNSKIRVHDAEIWASRQTETD